MSRPVVGIVAAYYDVPRHWGVLPVQAVPRPFPALVAAAGGLPVLLPLLAEGDPADLLDAVDGLVLAGGGDLDPATYGGVAGVASDVDLIRDAVELALANAAVARALPVLGVCRGAQVLNVARGGTLRQEVEEHVLPRQRHEVRSAAGTLTAELLGSRPRVNSLHHQAVGLLGVDVVATAWADDGTIEALEVGQGPAPVALGVQWHPEIDPGPVQRALFGWLVDAARRTRLVRSPAP